MKVGKVEECANQFFPYNTYRPQELTIKTQKWIGSCFYIIGAGKSLLECSMVPTASFFADWSLPWSWIFPIAGFSTFISQNLPTSFIFYFLSYTLKISPLLMIQSSCPFFAYWFISLSFAHVWPYGPSRPFLLRPKNGMVSITTRQFGWYIWRTLTGIYILRMSIYWSIRLHCILFLFIVTIAWGGGVSGSSPSFKLLPFVF